MFNSQILIKEYDIVDSEPDSEQGGVASTYTVLETITVIRSCKTTFVCAGAFWYYRDSLAKGKLTNIIQLSRGGLPVAKGGMLEAQVAI